MLLDEKQTRVIFLFEFKLGCKVAETTLNINSKRIWSRNC